MVIVDPHEVVRIQEARYAVGELAIHGQIRFPVLRVEVTHRLEIMKDRPNDLVGKPLVELAVFFPA